MQKPARLTVAPLSGVAHPLEHPVSEHICVIAIAVERVEDVVGDGEARKRLPIGAEGVLLDTVTVDRRPGAGLIEELPLVDGDGAIDREREGADVVAHIPVKE